MIFDLQDNQIVKKLNKRNDLQSYIIHTYPMKQTNNFGDTMNKLKQICKDTEKFDRKIIGKQFLVGKYFDGQKNHNKSKKQKKYTSKYY